MRFGDVFSHTITTFSGRGNKRSTRPLFKTIKIPKMKGLKVLAPYIHPFRVHVPNLLNETFINAVRPKDLAALRIPLNMMNAYLISLTGRCAELNDPILNKLMCDMTLYEQSNMESKEYSAEMVEQVNKNYKEFMEIRKK